MKIKTNIRAGRGSTSTDSTDAAIDTSVVSGSNSKKTLGGGATSGGGRCAGY
jgi:hypothetical protein